MRISFFCEGEGRGGKYFENENTFFTEENKKEKKESIRREMLGARKIFKSVLFYICALGLVCF